MSTLVERAPGFTPASRLDGLAVSEIIAMKARAAALRQSGRDVIDLSIGEPDFRTPDSIVAAAKSAMERGETHYTPTAGTAALRQAVIAKVSRDNRRRVSPEQVFVGVGAKQVISNALLALLESGDEVVVPAPYWSNYPDMVRLAGGRPVIVQCPDQDGFKLTPATLERALSPRTRAIILNSPSNPTGATYNAGELADLAAVLRAFPRVLVIEDAIYEHILFDDADYVSLLDSAPDLADRTLWVNGVSKAYAMTGWRIGYGVGPTPWIDAMTVVAAHTTSHPCSIAQAAAAFALTADQQVATDLRDAFSVRRELVSRKLSGAPGLSLVKPAGAFYAFPSVQGLLGLTASGAPLKDDRALAAHLLESQGVATVPGSAFGAPGYLRISFAASNTDLVEACRRLAECFSQLKPA